MCGSRYRKCVFVCVCEKQEMPCGSECVCVEGMVCALVWGN